MVPVPSRFVDPKPPPEPVRLGAGADAGDLDRWVSTGRVEEAAAERSRRRWLERQAREDLTIRGVLRELAEHGGAVSVHTTGGSMLAGTVATVGADFVTLACDPGTRVIVGLSAVAALHTGITPGPDERVLPERATLAATLAELAVERPEVVVRAGGDDIRGALVAGGRDLVTIRPAGEAPMLVHVAMAAVDHLVVLDR